MSSYWKIMKQDLTTKTSTILECLIFQYYITEEVNIKTCIICKKEKDENNFYIRSHKTPQYKRSECKECSKLLLKERKDYHKKYNKEHYEDKKEYMLNWFRSQKYRDYLNNKRHNDPNLRIHRSISASINRVLKHNESSKKTFSLLSFSKEDLIKHLKKTLPVGYKFDDYGYKLHLDHIIPKNIYDISSEEYFKKCWNIRNLRLISSKENLKKKDKIYYSLIKEYGIQDLLPNSLGG